MSRNNGYIELGSDDEPAADPHDGHELPTPASGPGATLEQRVTALEKSVKALQVVYAALAPTARRPKTQRATDGGLPDIKL